MAGSVATCAGASGGAQPPPDPHRLLSHCESAPTTQQQEKQQGRGQAKGNDIVRAVATGGRLKVDFDKDNETYKAIGPNAAWYISAVGIHTRDCCDPFYDKWLDVPPQQKAMIRQRMLSWFDIDLSGILGEVLDRDANQCYNDWKGTLLRFFKNNGGLTGAPVKRHRSVRCDEQWQRCCERFASPDFQDKSKTNSKNRQINEDVSFHGRRSYTQIRYDKMDLQTGELYSVIDNWGDQRTRGGTWSSTEQAKQKHNMMVEERQTQMMEFGSSNEKDILNKNMKKRKGRQSGVGLTLPKSAVRRSNDLESTAGTSSTPEVHAHIQRLETTVTRLMDALQRFIPGFQLDQSNDPSSSSSAAHNHDDEDAPDLQD